MYLGISFGSAINRVNLIKLFILSRLQVTRVCEEGGGVINEVTRLDINIRVFLALESSVLFNPLIFYSESLSPMVVTHI